MLALKLLLNPAIVEQSAIMQKNGWKTWHPKKKTGNSNLSSLWQVLTKITEESGEDIESTKVSTQQNLRLLKNKQNFRELMSEKWVQPSMTLGRTTNKIT